MARPDVALWCTKVHKLWAFGRGRWYSGGFRLEYVATKNKLILYYVFPGHSACGRARGGGSAAMKLPRRSQDAVLASFAAAPATMPTSTALTVCRASARPLCFPLRWGACVMLVRGALGDERAELGDRLSQFLIFKLQRVDAGLHTRNCFLALP